LVEWHFALFLELKTRTSHEEEAYRIDASVEGSAELHTTVAEPTECIYVDMVTDGEGDARLQIIVAECVYM